MKRDIGWGASIAVAVAAVVGISQFGGRPAQNAPETARTRVQASPSKVKPTATKSAAQFEQGPCQDLEERLQAFLGVLDEGSIVAPGACVGQDPPFLAGTPWKVAGGFRFVIATMDDPIYTHFALGFDRKAEAIQQAAADAGYVYDSSWLPWDPKETTYDRIADQDIADDRKDAREEQPGILLFRKALSGDVPKSDDPYKNGLAVFVVGDDPTDGIHRKQFQNATAWIAALKHTGESNPPYYELPKAILGPSFSGSLPSLAALLNDISLPPNHNRTISVFSGEVTSNASVEWFKGATRDRFDLHFASFQPADYGALDRYCRYLLDSQFELRHLAIVSEDETAFGADEAGSNCDGSASFYYPRDISALRSAYQKESVFNSGAAAPAADPRRTLATDLSDPEGQQHDTIRAFSGDQTALSQEAVLQQIVSFLRVHQSEYILLRSSNPLDQLFLSHYLRLAYGQGRIVILGADLLLRREHGAARLSGIMTLSSYPLYPWGADWTRGPEKPYSDIHPFPQDGAEGTYVAMRYLLCAKSMPPAYVPVNKSSGFGSETTEWLQDSGYRVDTTDLHQPGYPQRRQVTITSPQSEKLMGKPDETYTRRVTLKIDNDMHVIEDTQEDDPKTPEDVKGTPLELRSQFLPVDPALDIPDYNSPFWLRSPGGAPTVEAPPLWLSVLGTSDFWPVAALNNQAPPPLDKDNPKPSTFQQLRAWLKNLPLALWEATQALTRICFHWPAREAYATDWKPWPRMPGSFGLAIVGLFLWIAFHFRCCYSPSVMQKPSHRAYFVCTSDTYWPHRLLLATASASLSAMTTAIAWGFGAFSQEGILFDPAWAGQIIFVLGWLIPCFAVVFNLRWQFRQLRKAPAAVPPSAPAVGPGKNSWGRKAFRFLGHKLSPYCSEAWPVGLLWPVGVYLAETLGFYLFSFVFCEAPLTLANSIPTYWRCMHLASGVSPVILLLAPAAGVYLWCWFSLQKLALYGPDRPQLPNEKSLEVKIDGHTLSMNMFSQKFAGRTVERQCNPSPVAKVKWVVIVAAVLSGLAYLLSGEVPLRTLGQLQPSIFVCILIVVCVAILLTCAWQLLHAWIGLRQLLNFLYLLRLRRSVAALPGESWTSVWTISGNVFDMRYKLLSTQNASAAHLKNSFAAHPEVWQLCGWGDVSKALDALQKAHFRFTQWYMQEWNKADEVDETRLKEVQEALAETAGVVLAQVLVPAWRDESGPKLCADPCNTKQNDTAAADDHVLMPIAALKPHIRYAEQFVCYVYLGFIQNTLGQMRSLVMSIVWLFVAVTLTTASYPFDPRPVISGAAIVLSLVLGVVIVFVYAQMHRDPILSLITNTTPGELGGDFWVKLVGFGVGPAIGLIATLFPQIADFAYSWVQPSVGSIK